MPIPDSGKIALGVVAALGTIAVLHLTIFKNRASEFEKARTDHDSVSNQYQSLGNPPDLRETYSFKFKTLGYTRDYWELMEDLKLTVPVYYIPQIADIDRQRQDFIDMLGDLERRRDDNVAPKLSFISNPAGWDLQDRLSQAASSPGVIEDLVQRLQGQDRLLNVLDKTSELYATRLAEYEELLRNIGLDLKKREQIKNTYGELPALLYSLNRIQLVRKTLGPNFFKDMTDIQAQNTLYALFRVEWPVDANPLYGMYPYYRQSEYLKSMLNLAEQSGISEITFLRMWEPRDTYYDPNRKSGATPTPEAAGIDRRFDRDNPDVVLDDFLGNTDSPTREKAAVALPFQLEFNGTNLTNMAFLDLVARGRVPMELDAMTVLGVPQSENQQIVRCVINTMGYIPALFLTDEMIANGKAETLKSMVEVSSKAGGREEAIKAGFLNADGSLAQPTPAAAVQ